MSKPLRICIGQFNFFVGDPAGNAGIIKHAIKQAQVQHQADLLIFPELALSGYPPEDLLFRQDFLETITEQLADIHACIEDKTVILGLPHKTKEGLFNAAAILQAGKPAQYYFKQRLPNYGVFDEKRYFTPGSKTCVIEINGCHVGLSICEDIWHSDVVNNLKQAGAEVVVCLNASPYHDNKQESRLKLVKQRIEETHLPIVYVQMVGGQDELLFDGGSFACDDKGNTIAQAEYFKESLFPITINKNKSSVSIQSNELTTPPSNIQALYEALVLGVHDYVCKNNFKEVMIGVSGGLDSALTAAIAVDALGKENVEAVLLPSQFTSELSHDCAMQLIDNLGIKHRELPIQDLYENFLSTLAPEFKNAAPDTTEENIQARIRGVLLMALSNKFNKIILSTGNKSEMAVGYATLYGDMVGALAVLKDVYKTRVYELAAYCNTQGKVIPQAIIDRAPTAELAENQTDQDTLPPYPTLDAILTLFIEQDRSLTDIVDAGFDHDTVVQVIHAVKINEYKRRQAPPGIRVTRRAFGRERRFPISSGFNID